MIVVKNITIEVLRAFGLILTDKDRVSAPFVQPQRKRKPVKQILAENVEYDQRGKPWIVEETGNGMTFDLLTDRNTKKLKSDVEIREVQQAIQAGLNEKKYRKLKPYWAQGFSAAKCANIHKNERGYSRRTVEKYWSFFNGVSPSR